MGLFDSLRQVAAESAGRVMMQFYKGAREEMAAMNESVRNKIVTSYCAKREDLILGLSNMTEDGIRKTGQDYQKAGNKLKRTSPAEGLPLLLLGLWLESSARPGPDAANVFLMLDNLAIQNGGSPVR